MAGRNELQPGRLTRDATGAPQTTSVEERTMRIVERVGKRFIVGCVCGNYFFAVPGIAICDNCGAEGDTEALPTEGDAAQS